MLLKKYVIYLLENLINGKKYVGQTGNFNTRMTGHKNSIKRNYIQFH